MNRGGIFCRIYLLSLSMILMFAVSLIYSNWSARFSIKLAWAGVNLNRTLSSYSRVTSSLRVMTRISVTGFALSLVKEICCMLVKSELPTDYL